MKENINIDNNKFYKIEQVLELLRTDKNLIFEIRSPKEKDGWYEHMLLICVRGFRDN